MGQGSKFQGINGGPITGYIGNVRPLEDQRFYHAYYRQPQRVVLGHTLLLRC